MASGSPGSRVLGGNAYFAGPSPQVGWSRRLAGSAREPDGYGKFPTPLMVRDIFHHHNPAPAVSNNSQPATPTTSEGKPRGRKSHRSRSQRGWTFATPVNRPPGPAASPPDLACLGGVRHDGGRKPSAASPLSGSCPVSTVWASGAGRPDRTREACQWLAADTP